MTPLSATTHHTGTLGCEVELNPLAVLGALFICSIDPCEDGEMALLFLHMNQRTRAERSFSSMYLGLYHETLYHQYFATSLYIVGHMV